MKTLALTLGVLFAMNVGATEDLYKTSKELRRKEDREQNVKEVPTLPANARPTPKKVPQVECLTETGEALVQADPRL